MLQVVIHIKGSIDPGWSDWLAGMQITPLPDKETLLCGSLPDQAALYGVISHLNNLRLALISVQVQEVQKQAEE